MRKLIEKNPICTTQEQTQPSIAQILAVQITGLIHHARIDAHQCEIKALQMNADYCAFSSAYHILSIHQLQANIKTNLSYIIWYNKACRLLFFLDEYCNSTSCLKYDKKYMLTCKWNGNYLTPSSADWTSNCIPSKITRKVPILKAPMDTF